MAISDILLWSFAFILSFIGIFISWIGAVNSSKANEKLTNFFAHTWTEDEAKHLFFDQLKSTQVATAHVLQELNKLAEGESFSYLRYSEISKKTRLPFVSEKINDILTSSRYASILKSYKHHKTMFDTEFAKIFDFKKFKSSKKLSNKELYIIKKYHHAMSDFNQIIMSEYVKIAQNNGE